MSDQDERAGLPEPIPSTGSVRSFDRGEHQPLEDGEYMPSAATADRKLSHQVVAAGFLKHHSGPLPAPETLAQYEQILPGAAERIFVRFEKQSDHRMKMEDKAISSNTFSQTFATVGSVIFSIIALFATTFLVHEGKSLSGLSVFFGTVASVSATFFYGKHSQQKERENALKQQNQAELKSDSDANSSEQPNADQ